MVAAIASRILYLHGLEGSPEGTKGRWLRDRYGAYCPLLPATAGSANAFDDSFEVAYSTLRKVEPALVIGSSFGGALLLRLVQEGHWRGPSLFLAQAGRGYGLRDSLQGAGAAILIHAKTDSVVPFQWSAELAANSGDNVQLWPTTGDHRLHHILADGSLAAAISQLLAVD